MLSMLLFVSLISLCLLPCYFPWLLTFLVPSQCKRKPLAALFPLGQGHGHQHHSTTALCCWSRIAAHAYSWRVHHGQEHLFAARVLLGARIAQPASTLVDTLGTDLAGCFATSLAGDQRCFISGEHLDRFSLASPSRSATTFRRSSVGVP